MNKKMPNKIYTRGSQLDCETEKGAYFIDKQYSTTNILKNKYPSLIFKHRKLKTAGEDCYVYHNNKLSAVSEIKCRPYINRDKKIPFTFEILKNRYKNEYLITAEKIISPSVHQQSQRYSIVCILRSTVRELHSSTKNY